MPIHKPIPPFKLTKVQRKVIVGYLKGTETIASTTKTLGITRQRLYTMITALMRHMVATEKIDVEELIKQY